MPDAHFVLYFNFHSSQAAPKGLGQAHYNNSEVDELLEQAAKETDENKRLELYKKATEIIWNDAPWIFLYVQKWFYASTKDLKGYTIYIDGEQIYFNKACFS